MLCKLMTADTPTCPNANTKLPAVCHYMYWPFTLSISKVMELKKKQGWGEDRGVGVGVKVEK